MNKPKMIIFDYGHTLLYEPGFDFLHGEEALFEYVKNNKNGLTPKQVSDFSQKLFEKIGVARELGLELHEWQFQRFLYEYLEIELSISLPEAERIFWYHVSAGKIMPNADKMIDFINTNGIRSGVISNIGFSGAALTERINRLLPHNRFEFIIASSEYMFRKPNPMLFELALKKAGLNAGDVWFCGDNIKADVEGSVAVGIFPVWYEDESVENPWRGQNNEIKPTCKHLHIHDWLELIDILKGVHDEP
ncbi:MAG: HAD family hydrolase [Oscillospiraceae bacterium]|jgi:putative hydrolase of the HAD superfamily|nr:HAD family hydrolase [Oscillospiraceae bacterium]